MNISMEIKSENLNFWSSLITSHELWPQLESLFEIEDIEERGLALLCKVTFLWCLGIKYKRDALSSLVQKIENAVEQKLADSCKGCTHIKSLIKNFLLNVSLNSNKETDSKSNSPKKRSPKKNKENIEDLYLHQTKCGNILVPETDPLPMPQITGHTNQAFIIPETVPLDQPCYGHTDVFDLSCEESPVKVKGERSPILGKQNKESLTPASLKLRGLHSRISPLSENKSRCSSKNIAHIDKMQEHIQTPESASKSPSLLACQELKDFQNATKSLIVESFKSPKYALASLSEDKEDKYQNQDSFSIFPQEPVSVINPPFTQTRLSLRSQNKPLRSPQKKSLPKSKSELSSSFSTLTRLSRLKKLTCSKESKIDLQLEIDTSKSIKKKYRQTKITSDCFIQKSGISKGTVQHNKATTLQNEGNNANLIRAAIEDSLRTKQVEDLMRAKNEQLNQNMPKIKKLRCDANEVKEKVLFLKDSPQQISKEHKSKEGLIESQNDQAAQSKGANKLRKSKACRAIEDSFDLVPPREKERPFAYKNDVVRKKSERRNLDGWDCHQCRDYYEAKGCSDSEKKELQNKCSRHRSKHRMAPNTPEGYWVMGWGDDSQTPKES